MYKFTKHQLEVYCHWIGPKRLHVQTEKEARELLQSSGLMTFVKMDRNITDEVIREAIPLVFPNVVM